MPTHAAALAHALAPACAGVVHEKMQHAWPAMGVSPLASTK